MTTTDEQATAQEPLTWPQIQARLEEIAPFDADGTGPVAAVDLARNMAICAQRRWRRNLSRYFSELDEATRREFGESVASMCAEFAALHLLMVLAEADPAKANEAATQIRDAWADGGMIGERLYGHQKTLGIDPDEVSRLEEAWQALPEVREARKGSGDE